MKKTLLLVIFVSFVALPYYSKPDLLIIGSGRQAGTKT